MDQILLLLWYIIIQQYFKCINNVFTHYYQFIIYSKSTVIVNTSGTQGSKQLHYFSMVQSKILKI